MDKSGDTARGEALDSTDTVEFVSKRRLRCELCELGKPGQVNCLDGRGSGRSGIMIVTSGVSEDDEYHRRFLAGDHGRKFNWLLEQAGLSADGLFIVGALRCPRRGAGKAKRAVLAACSTHLQADIERMSPRVIVTIGPTAARQVLGEEAGSLDAMRGFPIRQPTPDGDRWVLPMWDLSRAFLYPEDDEIVIRDLRLAFQIAEHGWKSRPLPVRVNVTTSMDGLKDLVTRLRDEPAFGFDLETDGFDFTTGRILCASFGFNDGTASVIPVNVAWDPMALAGRWSAAEEAKVYECLRFIMRTRATKSAHNGKFDAKWLRADAKVERIRNFDFDTMLAWALLEPDKLKDLVFVGQLLGVIHEKYDAPMEAEFLRIGARNYREVRPDILFRYAGIDAWVTQRLRPILEKRLEEAGLDRIFQQISMPLSETVTDMEYYGARIDRSGLEDLAAKTANEIEGYRAELKKIVPDPAFNPNSTKQLTRVLGEFGCKLTKKTDSGKSLACGEEVLEGLAQRNAGRGLPRLILNLRRQSKFLGTSVLGLKGILDANDRVHTTFHVSGTITGRLSSAMPNLQNIPKAGGLRELFIPDEPGDEFLNVDYAQLEVRITAAIFKDPVLIQEIRDGVDMHSVNACLVWGYDLEEFKLGAKDKTHPQYPIYSTKRDNAKRITFGVLYGSGAEGVAEREEIPVEEAEEFIDRFFRKYRVVARGIKDAKRRALSDGVIRTQIGRRYRFLALPWWRSGIPARKFKGRAIGEIERVAVNLPIQAFGSDIFSLRKTALAAELRRRGMKSRLVLTIHDGFVMNVKPTEKAVVEALVPEIMNLKLNEGMPEEVPLFVEMGFSDRWKK